MKLLSALIVDDEIHGRKNLANLLSTNCPEIIVAGMAADAAETEVKIKELKPDVVFLDIMMPGMNGLEFLEAMTECNFAAVIVSAYADFGIKAIKCGVVDYLLKPIDSFELKKSIPKINAYHNLKKRDDLPSKEAERIVATHTEGFSVLNLNDIVYFEADRNYATIHLTSGEKLIVCRRLKDFEDHIPMKDFFRVQRSFLINLSHVRQYLNADGGSVVMTDNRNIPVSKIRHQDFIERLKHLAVFP